MTATAQPADERRFPKIGLGSTLTAEWAKLWSVRSSWVSIVLAVLLSIGVGALIAIAIGATADEMPGGVEAFDPILFSLPGSIFWLILLSVLAVMFVSAEYSSGMIRLTFTITPQRARVFAAKVAIITVVSWVIATVATVGMFLASQAIFAGYDLPTAALDDPDALRVVAGLSVLAPLFPIIGVAIAFLLRSTAGAITAVLGIVFLPDILAPLLPAWWQENVIAWLPAAASDAITIGHLEQTPYALDVGPAIAAVIGWLILFLALAYLSVVRRDA
jgi:ABC-2 type transport system permease protein